MLKREKGITLIALVVTIIVLLILAAVSIGMLTGENGIINQAKNAQKNNEESAAKEKLEMLLNELAINKQTDSTYTQKEYIDNKLNSQEGITVLENDIIVVDGWTFQIDRTVPKIIENLGQGEINKQIVITATDETSNDYVKSTITIEIKYEKEIETITLNGTEIQVPEKQEGKYIITTEVTENGKYTIIAKDKDNKFNIGSIKISGITEDMEIWNKADLEKFRDMVNSGRTFKGRTAIVKEEIDLEGNESNQWIPINNFQGTFEGDKKKIKNLYIDNEKDENAGLFGMAINAKIQNVVISSGKITLKKSTQNVGSVLGVGTNTSIYGCENYINIASGNVVGGIVGYLAGKSIENCSNNGEIEGRIVGGIIGHCGHHQNGQIKKCYNNGSIKIVDGTVTYMHAGGGIIGKLMDIVDCQIENCYNVANITTNISTKEGSSGGIIGFCQYQKQKGQLKMTNCYNTGKMNLSNTDLKGGIIGFTSNENQSTIKYDNNYWLTGCGASYGIGYPTNNTGVTYKSSTEIQGITVQLGEAYTDDIQDKDGKWKYNEGYPILKWQIEQ